MYLALLLVLSFYDVHVSERFDDEPAAYVEHACAGQSFEALAPEWNPWTDGRCQAMPVVCVREVCVFAVPRA